MRSIASLVRSKLQYISYQRDTARIIRKVLKRDSNCIDVGCHEGKFLEVMLEAAPVGTHYAFEPLPPLFARLKREYGNHPAVRISDTALAEREGAAEFIHVVNSPGYSGFRQRDYDRKKVVTERIIVETNTIDNIIPADMHITLMKMVVEGAEFQVLRGALRTIKRSRPAIIYESGLGAADHFGTSAGDVYRLLTEECGLKINTPRRYLDGSRPLTAGEYEKKFNERLDYYFIAFP